MSSKKSKSIQTTLIFLVQIVTNVLCSSSQTAIAVWRPWIDSDFLQWGFDSIAEARIGQRRPLKKPDRSVSSFARLLWYDDSGKLHSPESMSETTGGMEVLAGVDGFGENKGGGDDDDIGNLGELFKDLGLCMMVLGILVARACDIVIGGNQLEQSITDFGSAKARLIHYHSELDNRIIKKRSSTRRKTLANNAVAAAARRLSDHIDTSCRQMSGSEDGSCIKSAEENSLISLVNLWQEWHYDYGVLTVLTAPLFLRSALGQECPVSKEFSLQ